MLKMRVKLQECALGREVDFVTKQARAGKNIKNRDLDRREGEAAEKPK